MERQRKKFILLTTLAAGILLPLYYLSQSGIHFSGKIVGNNKNITTSNNTDQHNIYNSTSVANGNTNGTGSNISPNINNDITYQTYSLGSFLVNVDTSFGTGVIEKNIPDATLPCEANDGWQDSGISTSDDLYNLALQLPNRSDITIHVYSSEYNAPKASCSKFKNSIETAKKLFKEKISLYNSIKSGTNIIYLLPQRGKINIGLGPETPTYITFPHPIKKQGHIIGIEYYSLDSLEDSIYYGKINYHLFSLNRRRDQLFELTKEITIESIDKPIASQNIDPSTFIKKEPVLSAEAIRLKKQVIYSAQ